MPSPEIWTCWPSMKLFVVVWNVTTFEVIENEVIDAAKLQSVPEHAPKGAAMLITSVSGAFVP